MRILRVLLAVIGTLLVFNLDMVEAAKKKAAAPAPPKAIYEAPMRVFIVRNSNPLCEPNCPEWIGAEGEITAATPAQFRKVLKQAGKKKLPVIIRSPGGSINAALEISRMIRKAGLSVAVGHTQFSGCSPTDKSCKLPPENKGVYQGIITDINSFCNSACPMILAGGVTRFAGPFASVGLHEPKTIWTREQVRYRETYRLVGGKKKVVSRKVISRKTVRDKITYGLDKRLRKNLVSHYKTMGVDVDILDDMVKAKYQDIYYLSEIRKSMLKLVTSSSSAVMLANPKFCGSVSVCIVDKRRTPQTSLAAPPTSKNLDGNNRFASMTFAIYRNSQVACEPKCPTWVFAQGRIEKDTYSKFLNFVVKHSFVSGLLVLDSPGGHEEEAMKMGKLIRSRDLHTALGVVEVANCPDNRKECSPQPALISSKDPGVCEGECVFLFVAGTERILAEKQSLLTPGLAQLDKFTSTSRTSKIRNYLNELSVHQFVADHMLTIDYWKRGELPTKEIQKLKISTRLVSSLASLLNAESCKAASKAIYCRKLN